MSTDSIFITRLATDLGKIWYDIAAIHSEHPASAKAYNLRNQGTSKLLLAI